jgi:hypothetical protein
MMDAVSGSAEVDNGTMNLEILSPVSFECNADGVVIQNIELISSVGAHIYRCEETTILPYMEDSTDLPSLSQFTYTFEVYKFEDNGVDFSQIQDQTLS